MLAYELYLMNKDSKRNLDATGKVPIKKIFYSEGTAEIDSTTIQGFGSPTEKKTEFLQNWLSMPLPTTRADNLNLPNKKTGKSSPNPYIILDGNFKKKTKSSDAQILLEFTGKKRRSDHSTSPSFSAVYNITKDTKKFSANGNSYAYLEEKFYELGEKSLFKEYISSEIITNDGKLKPAVFKSVAKEFFEFVKSRPLDPEPKNQSSGRFTIHILPNNKKINFKDNSISTSNKNFKDYFGNNVSSIATKVTKNAKFLSYDDKAFTPNGLTGEKFYETIGIGSESLDKITLPQDKIFQFSGLNWIFIDMLKPDFEFENVISGGIFHQLFTNYKKLESRAGGRFSVMSMMKIIAIQFDNNKSKTEILLDENLTMEKMKHLFSDLTISNVPFSAIEILIEKNENKVLWKNYLQFITALLRGYGYEYSHLLMLFTKLIRKDIHSWLDEAKNTISNQKDFFVKTNFCREILCTSKTRSITLNQNEEYAYRIGKIAGIYVWFRKSIKDTPNSIKDILTYAKYDKTALQHVFQQVARGINFTKKADEDETVKLQKYINSILPKDEINPSDEGDDYSYFFYKGMTETITGKAN